MDEASIARRRIIAIQRGISEDDVYLVAGFAAVKTGTERVVADGRIATHIVLEVIPPPGYENFPLTGLSFEPDNQPMPDQVRTVLGTLIGWTLQAEEIVRAETEADPGPLADAPRPPLRGVPPVDD